MVQIDYGKEYREAVYAMNEAAIQKEEEKNEKLLSEAREFADERRAILESVKGRVENQRNYHTFIMNEMLGTALKAIYIGAIDSIDLPTPQAHRFCESRVDQFIEDRGGACNILTEMAGKTYLLSRIATIVEDAAAKVEEEADEDDKATNTVPHGAKEEMFDKLEDEEDVDTAVSIIADRITNAEEEFIKKNADDKKKIEGIVNDINDRIAAVKDSDDMTDEEKDTAEEQLEQESAKLISGVYNAPKSQSLFEFMVRKNTDIIVKDPQLKANFQNESGKLDMDRIVDTTSYMYGFLEFVNTIGLEKIDSEYVSNMIDSM